LKATVTREVSPLDAMVWNDFTSPKALKADWSVPKEDLTLPTEETVAVYEAFCLSIRACWGTFSALTRLVAKADASSPPPAPSAVKMDWPLELTEDTMSYVLDSAKIFYQ
jgi:hypothetical protein